MKTSVSMKIEFIAGTSIDDAFEDAVELANKIGCIMEFKFNDVTCLAYPHNNPKTGVHAYHYEIQEYKLYKLASTSK